MQVSRYLWPSDVGNQFFSIHLPEAPERPVGFWHFRGRMLVGILGKLLLGHPLNPKQCCPQLFVDNRVCNGCDAAEQTQRKAVDDACCLFLLFQIPYAILTWDAVYTDMLKILQLCFLLWEVLDLDSFLSLLGISSLTYLVYLSSWT